MNATVAENDACRKLRGTLLEICNSGLNPYSLNAMTLKTIYDGVVIPKGLFGSELWTNM